MGSSLLKATAVATVLAVLAATAEATGSAIATADFLLSPTFLWVAANAIIIWLLSSSRRRRATGDDDNAPSSAAAGHDDDVAVDSSSLYTSSSEYKAFSDAGSSARRAIDAPMSRRLPRDREARAGWRADRPRVRKKPAGHQVPPTPTPSPRAVVAAASREPDEDILRRDREETPAAAATGPRTGGDGGDDDEDMSMDSLWESIVQRRVARPVVVQKSESWGNEELPRLQRVVETAATTARREMRKSVSAVSKAPVPTPPSSAARETGWRTRDVLMSIPPDDELLRRADSFIRRQREDLRLQRHRSPSSASSSSSAGSTPPPSSASRRRCLPGRSAGVYPCS